MKNTQILTLMLFSTVFVFSDSLAKSCGPSCEYTIDDAGNVVVSGTGTFTGLSAADKALAKNVTIENGIESIGNSALAYSYDLTSVTIPDSVTSIGSQAFHYNKSLTDITIPSSVTTIGWHAFSDTHSLSDVNILGQNVSVNDSFIWSHASNISHNGITTSCGSDCTVTIDGNGNAVYTGTGALTQGAIQGFNIISADIENGITSIGNSAFAYSYNLTSVTIPDSVTSIGSQAFHYNKSLTGVTIPDSVTTIGWHAFSDTHSLKDVSILGQNVNVNEDAFIWSGASSGKVTYTSGGTTEQYILGKFPNANLKRIIGPHKYWTMDELREVIKPKGNTVSLTW